LKSEDGNLVLIWNPAKSHETGTQYSREQLPIFPNIKFNDLSVNGIIANGEVILSDFFAHIHGGTLTGKGCLIEQG